MRGLRLGWPASCEDVLHALEDAYEAPEEAVYTCVQKGSLLGAGAPDAVAGGLGVEEIISLLAECTLKRDGERYSEACEANGEAGPAADVEVGEFVEGALHLEEVRELVVERKDARPAG